MTAFWRPCGPQELSDRGKHPVTRLICIVFVAVLAAGCSGARCDKVREYQQVRPRPPLQVPGDLSEPELRSRAPQVSEATSPRRNDGRCLEEPPEFVSEEAADESNS